MSAATELFGHLFADGKGYIGVLSGKHNPGSKRLTAVRSDYFPFPQGSEAAASGFCGRTAKVARPTSVPPPHETPTEEAVCRARACSLYRWRRSRDPAMVPPPNSRGRSSRGRHWYFYVLKDPIDPRRLNPSIAALRLPWARTRRASTWASSPARWHPQPQVLREYRGRPLVPRSGPRLHGRRTGSPAASRPDDDETEANDGGAPNPSHRFNRRWHASGPTGERRHRELARSGCETHDRRSG